jgi:hypothetical protein
MDPLSAPIYVIGFGEVGQRLARALGQAGVDAVPVTRDSGWDRVVNDPEGVRLICVREQQLAVVLERLEQVPDRQIVLVQNGWIRPLLEDRPDVTRGLIWFTSKGEFFRVLRPSPFTGPLADRLVGALEAGGIPASAVDSVEFAALDADKMGFNCVVGLPLAVHQRTLGDYLDGYRDEAHELFTESVTACAEALRTTVDPAWWPRFINSAEPLGWVRATVAKALEFRNGAVAKLASQLGLETPVTDRLLRAHAER